MAYALVGSAGAVSTGTSGASVTPAWGTGESRTAGNLLILVVSGFGTATLPSAPAGWSIAKQIGNSTSPADSASIFYKIAAGSDAAPTVGAVTSTILSAQLYEFSGNVASSPLDQTASATSQAIAGEAIYSASATDAAAGELIICSSAVRLPSAVTSGAGDAVSNGATVSMTETTNNATSTQNHYCFGYGVTTVNSGVDQNDFTWNGGTGTAISSVMASFKVLPPAPVNTVAPAATGTATVGNALSTTNGTWNNSPTSFTYQWQRDNTGGGTYSNIGSATSSSYTLVDTDDGCNIRCVVTATNAGGSTPANSNSLGTVVEPAPVNTVAPVASGTPTSLHVLSVTNGTWNNMAGLNPTYTYQWQTSPDGVSSWTNIGGATSATYTISSGDLGNYLRCNVTAHNSGSP